MVYTPIANIPQISENQIAHITHNEAIVSLEALSIGVVIDRTLTSPPSSPNEGDIYIPASGSTGAWATQDDNLAEWFNGSWIFYAPIPYSPKWSIGDSSFIYYDGSNWVLVSAGVISVNGQTGVVVLDTDDISEGSTNLYYTDTRVAAYLASIDTDDIAEGSTNKYAHAIANTSTTFTHRSTLTFLGDGVTVADDSGGDRTTVTINKGVPFVEFGSTQTSSFSLSSLHHGLTIPCTGSFTITLPQLTSNVQTTIVNSNASTGTITFAAGSGS